MVFVLHQSLAILLVLHVLRGFAFEKGLGDAGPMSAVYGGCVITLTKHSGNVGMFCGSDVLQ